MSRCRIAFGLHGPLRWNYIAHALISFKEVQFLGAGSLISCERVNVRKQCMLLKYPSSMHVFKYKFPLFSRLFLSKSSCQHPRRKMAWMFLCSVWTRRKQKHCLVKTNLLLLSQFNFFALHILAPSFNLEILI